MIKVARSCKGEGSEGGRKRVNRPVETRPASDGSDERRVGQHVITRHRAYSVVDGDVSGRGRNGGERHDLHMLGRGGSNCLTERNSTIDH